MRSLHYYGAYLQLTFFQGKLNMVRLSRSCRQHYFCYFYPSIRDDSSFLREGLAHFIREKWISCKKQGNSSFYENKKKYPWVFFFCEFVQLSSSKIWKANSFWKSSTSLTYPRNFQLGFGRWERSIWFRILNSIIVPLPWGQFFRFIAYWNPYPDCWP